MEQTLTATALSMSLEPNGIEVAVRRAVARALENQEGHWRTDDRRDAKAVAEVACHMLLDEIKTAIADAQRLSGFARGAASASVDTHPEGRDTK